MTEMKKCRDFCAALSDYLDGEIGAKECRLIEEHLEECTPCSLTYQSLKATVEICGKACSREIPEDVKARLRAFLREHCGKE